MELRRSVINRGVGRLADRSDDPLAQSQAHYRRATVIDAFFDLADTIITMRSLIRQAWTTHRWTNARTADHDRTPIRATSQLSGNPVATIQDLPRDWAEASLRTRIDARPASER
jgi:hypothetical protein